MPQPAPVRYGPELPGSGARIDDDVRPHYEAYRADPSPKNAGAYLKSIRPILDSGVTAFGGRAPGPALTARAKQIALDATLGYDPERSALKTHLTNHLKGLQRYAAKSSQLLAVPERVALDRGHLDRAEEALEDELGRAPSTAEIADRTGISAKRQTYVRQYKPGFAEGQIARLTATAEDPAGGDPAVAGPDPIRERLEFLYPDLDPVNQAIVEHAFGLHGRRRLRVGELARRLNLTPGAISQRAAKIQGMVDQLGDTGVL